MNKNLTIKDEHTDFILYNSLNGNVRIEVFLHNENVWHNQKKMADLFGVQRPAITKHLRNIFDEGELKEEEVSSILEHTTKHGAIKNKTQTKTIKFYNLDAIIAVGYRVNSNRATQFRIWATKVLKEFMINNLQNGIYQLKTKSLYI